ncbi:MAG: sialidase family protein [Verrucomicrobiota bacterium JB024]|nr:sialidase family protein [Verrucomicrobiota bacterium JB024]
MIARSRDGARTWGTPQSISHRDIHREGSVWVSPEINTLADGRLAVICDLGNRQAHEEHVSLYDWQQPDRGMANYVFWSEDGGLTWSAPQQVDRVGGEPERISSLSNGDLIYTRTTALPRRDDRRMPYEYAASLPSYAYYRCDAVISSDGGKTWSEHILNDDQLYSDCEVGLVDMGGGTVWGIARCGDMAGYLGQPSRLLISHDYGRTWGAPRLLPIYGHRPIPGRLASGRLLVTHRNFWGTIATYASSFDPDCLPDYEPGCFIGDEQCARLLEGCYELTTGEGNPSAVAYALYPAEDAQTAVSVECEVRVRSADIHACNISAGCWVRLLPDRVCLADRPEIFASLDLRGWRRLRIERVGGKVSIWADGSLLLESELGNLWRREVGFGNRKSEMRGIDERSVVFERNAGVSQWRSFRVQVRNISDHAIDWKWCASQGFPDPFRRRSVLCLDYNATYCHAHNGYSGWTQLGDGTVVVVDYNAGPKPLPRPAVWAYTLDEADLPRE